MTIPGSAHPLLMASLAEPESYQIDRSLRFNSSDSAYLSRTPSVAGNRKTWTWAGWVKRTTLGTEGGIFSTYAGAHPNTSLFWQSEALTFHDYTVSYNIRLNTAAVFRDPSAWYHIVLAYDSTESTASDRAKLWVNGVLQTLSGTTVPSNFETDWNSATAHDIGRFAAYLDGYLADIHFIDGQALTPSSFGEFDTNGVWQPIAYTGTYGTNGFHLPFSDNSTAAALGTDTSPNGNDWTVNNLSVLTTPNIDVTGFTATSGPGAGTNNAKEPFDGESSSNTLYAHGYGLHYITVNTSTTPIPVQSSDTWTIYWSTSTTNPRDAQLRLTFTGGATTTYPVFTRTSGLQLNTITLGTTGSVTEIDFRETSSSSPGELHLRLIAKNGVPYSWNPGPDNDSLVDSPTNGDQTDTGAGGEVVGNYATLNPLDNGGATLSNGNLEWDSGGNQGTRATIFFSSGKWYWEFTSTESNLIGEHGVASISQVLTGNTAYPGSISTSWGFSNSTGNKSNSNSFTNITTAGANGDVIMIAVDMDAGKIWWGRNGSWFSSGNPATGANAAFANLSGSVAPMSGVGGAAAGAVTYNFGQRPFAYTAPSGFKALCTTNLPEPTIADGSTAMDVALWTGNSTSGRSITGLNASPDFVWIKSRSDAAGHALFDAVRGVNKVLRSMDTSAEEDSPAFGYVSQFNSDGFTLTAGTFPGFEMGDVNMSGRTYVAWTWDAGSSTVSNTDGSITSSVRANASAGFSVVTWTATNGNATIGHGLGAAPGLIIIKSRGSGTANWTVYHSSLGATKGMLLNLTSAASTDVNFWNNTSPTSTVFSAGSYSNYLTDGHVAYCFAPVDGYSSFGSYTGNGSADGPFVYTGFRPRWVLIKRTDTSGNNWVLHDSARDSYNAATKQLLPSTSDAETDTSLTSRDLLSNGFKLRGGNAAVNASGGTYIYASFSENPFSIARAR